MTGPLQLERYAPNGALRTFASSIIRLSGDATGIAFQRMYQTIIINMGRPFTACDIYGDTFKKRGETEPVWINGKQETPLLIENDSPADMYVIGVKYGMLPFLTGLPAMESNGKALGASHWSADILGLRERLSAVSETSVAFMLINEHFDRLLQQKTPAQSEIDRVDWLSKAINNAKVQEICDGLKVTRKALRTEALHYFGGPVKHLQGMIRFNRLLADIAGNTDQPLSRIHDHYDQSHFIHDFKARTGITPIQYKRLCQLYPGIKQTPNFLPLSGETFLQFISSDRV